MGLTNFVFWFLCFSLCQFWWLTISDPVIHGKVHSPQYPKPYQPNLLKQWELWAPKGYQIQLSLEHLDMQESTDCNQDSLTVLYDLKILGKFCGQEDSPNHPGNTTILSPGNRLTLIFQTSDSRSELQQHTGFSATYESIDIDECSEPDPSEDSGPLCSQICVNTPGSYHCSCYRGYNLHLDQRTCVLSCGGCMLDKPKGHLSSPGYPHPSPPFLSCKYIISVDPRFVIFLNFTEHFHIQRTDTQQAPSCQQHWLQVTIPGRQPMTLCGTKSPGLIATNSSIVRLDYHTDYDGLSRGWSLDYSTQEVKCKTPMRDGQDIKTYTGTCQSNGEWQLPLIDYQMIDCGKPEPLQNGNMTFVSGFQNQYLSVIQYHCKEPFYSTPGGLNVTFTCAANGKWKSNDTAVENLTCIPVCGRPTKHIYDYQRIIGGSNAPEHTIPWQVLINAGGRGGGAVIADRWILTAAHVLVYNGQKVPISSVNIYMGDTDVHRMAASPLHPASIHVHPDYHNADHSNYNNDIALVKLQDPITFNAAVMPLCLPPKNATYDTGVIGQTSGFGITDEGGKHILTNRLKYVNLPVVNQEICRNSFTLLKRRKPNLPDLTDNMFCAGIPEGNKDSCQGDNGSAFTLTENGQFWAAGVVSWGARCGQEGTYGVYTRVANYVDWINKVMKNN